MVSRGGLHAAVTRVSVKDVPGLAQARRGRVQRGVWRRAARRLRGGKADRGCVLVEGQGAVAVLAGEDGRGASVPRLIGRLALDGHVRLTPAWVVGFEEGTVHKALRH